MALASGHFVPDAVSLVPCPLNLLAFDTSTDVLRIAVRHGDAPARTHEAEGGARASATLIPAAMALLGQAGLALPDLQAIVFGCGPGSFTGLRTACSVAQGLALGAGLPVLPVETLMAVAEDARGRGAGDQVLAVLDARMDEVYAAAYAWDGGRWRRDGPIQLWSPQDLPAGPDWTVAGNAFPAYGDRLPHGAGRVDAAPTALALLRLAPALLAAGQACPAEAALPLYVRDKVAQTTAERAAARTAAAAGARISP
jgi:tRNA threonylcarbamoyladenosine biosynthesis protein TsaB